MSSSSEEDDNFTSKFFRHVQNSTQQYINELREAVSIPSVSSDLSTHLVDIIRMQKWTQDYVIKLGGTAELYPNPKGMDEDENELPPILLAEFRAGSDAEGKKTVCCYAHLDVQVRRVYLLYMS